MISATIGSTSHEASWEHSATWLLWLGCAVSLAFIQSVPTIPAITFLGAVLAYCALFPRRAYMAVTWNFVPWAIVVFGVLSVLWSMEPMVSARAAPQIGTYGTRGDHVRAGIACPDFHRRADVCADFFDRRELLRIRHFRRKEQPRASTWRWRCCPACGCCSTETSRNTQEPLRSRPCSVLPTCCFPQVRREPC